MNTRIITYDTEDSIDTYMLADIIALQYTRWHSSIDEILLEEYTGSTVEHLTSFFPLNPSYRYSFSDHIVWLKREPFLSLLTEQFPHLFI